MLSNDKKLIAVIGATGRQGGGILCALQAGGQFKVRALTRSPDKHRELRTGLGRVFPNSSTPLTAHNVKLTRF